ncbi:hypothetical protein BSKO_04926 [Bryopsis sp. KO-2023]|nr:hypothetical protein BSKO_04926 [Bryopsis sp. KO-2023]
MEYITPEGLRIDGRRPKELRQLRCQVGSFENADGSANFEMGNTKVVAAVFGPREPYTNQRQIPEALVRCQIATAPFSTGERRIRGKRDRWSLEHASTIREALKQNILTELFPRTQIDIYIHVIQADGGIISAAINAGMLALADAGIPLRDLIASCSAGFLDKEPILDMNSLEEGGGGPHIPVAFQANTEKVVMLQMDRGRLPLDTFESIMELSVDGCRMVAQFLRKSLLEHTEKLALARGTL